jgi:hypothetical protein
VQHGPGTTWIAPAGVVMATGSGIVRIGCELGEAGRARAEFFERLG